MADKKMYAGPAGCRDDPIRIGKTLGKLVLGPAGAVSDPSMEKMHVGPIGFRDNQGKEGHEDNYLLIMYVPHYLELQVMVHFRCLIK